MFKMEMNIVQNELPELRKRLLSEYKYKIELHAHTKPMSSCSDIKPEKMAEVYSGLGYDGIVITNHFTHKQFASLSKEESIEKYIKDYEDTKKAAEKYGLKVYLGAEIRFTENMNDYLVYGVNKELLEIMYDYLPQGLSKFRESVHMENSIFIQAHPFRNGCEFADARYLDGIETFNMHPNHNSRVGVAVRHAAKSGLKITTAGSDYHHLNCDNEGLAALRVKAMPSDSFGLAEILKNGDYLFEIGDSAIVLA